ncbi:MAG TPA: SRPBCC family protein [Candidatus Acidoferrum sp.]|nr:SRPBCC family protein [Candidatus Acidoferrum sp.]
MIEIDHEIVIARPPEVVFDFVTDVANYPAWQPAIQRAEQTSPGEPGVGTQVRLVLRGPTGPIDILGEIVTFDRPTAFAMRSITGPAAIQARCTISQAGTSGDTRLRLNGSIELQGFLRFAEGQARKIVEREMPIAMADLARRIEGQV